MPADVVFPNGCGHEAEGRPCLQGVEKMICRRMQIKTESMFSSGDDVVIGEVVDRESGLPLDQAIGDSVLEQNWECYHCGRAARYVPDIDRFWSMGGMSLLENPVVPDQTTSAQNRANGLLGLDSFPDTDWGPTTPPLSPLDENFFDI